MLIDGTTGHSFCPAKLLRDDQAFAEDQRILWLAWKLGQVPSGTSLDTMSEADALRMLAMIRKWEALARADDFKTLGKLLVGDGNGK